ncbi:MAG: MoaD/ThiS family protein [Desulfatibacillaceae bacterium]
MTLTVRVPGSLRSWLGGADHAVCEGATVGQCIRNLDRRHPGILDKVMDTDRGAPKVILFLNGDNVMGLSGLDTPVSEGDELGVIPLAAGG